MTTGLEEILSNIHKLQVNNPMTELFIRDRKTLKSVPFNNQLNPLRRSMLRRYKRG